MTMRIVFFPPIHKSISGNDIKMIEMCLACPLTFFSPFHTYFVYLYFSSFFFLNSVKHVKCLLCIIAYIVNKHDFIDALFPREHTLVHS